MDGADGKEPKHHPLDRGFLRDATIIGRLYAVGDLNIAEMRARLKENRRAHNRTGADVREDE